MTSSKRYSELCLLDSFEERFAYLRLGGGLGQATFGFDRFLNQRFYASHEWHSVRDFVLVRDLGCDLGVPGFDIQVRPLIHHMNPMTPQDVIQHEDWILDPEFLITTTHNTHNAIHYGGLNPYPKVVTARSPQDTKLW